MRDHLLDRIVETEYDESGRACRTKTHDTAGHISTRTYLTEITDAATRFNITDDGYYIQTEHRINTPGGYKAVRYADAAVCYDSHIEIAIQVGVINRNGLPGSREVHALDDITEQAQIKTIFIPYRYL